MPLIYPDCFQGDQDVLNAFAAMHVRVGSPAPAAAPEPTVATSQPVLQHSVPRHRVATHRQSVAPIPAVPSPQRHSVPHSRSSASRQQRVVVVSDSEDDNASIPGPASQAPHHLFVPRHLRGAILSDDRDNNRQRDFLVPPGRLRPFMNDERPIPGTNRLPALQRALIRAQNNDLAHAGRSRPLVNDERPVPEAGGPPPQQALLREGDPYNVVSGRRTGVRATWADAGDATQGVPGGQVFRIQVTPPRPRHRRRCVAYVVFEGLAPGIYNTWPEAKALTNRVSGNIHQGFENRCEAERAYIVAFALGALRILPPRNGMVRQPLAAAIPTPEALMIVFAEASHDFLGAEWHVVFKGKRPGIYPAWNFAATQTKGVSCAIYKKYPSKAAAEAAFEDATRDGFVQIL